MSKNQLKRPCGDLSEGAITTLCILLSSIYLYKDEHYQYTRCIYRTYPIK